MVTYIYDAWGNHAVLDADGKDITDSEHIGNLNPFRYRGYYYDVETGLYFLQTRYYDPETGRFISQDSVEYAEPETVNGINLYAYCGNNPVMNIDPTGTSFFLVCLLVGLVVGAVAGATISGVNASNNGATGWELFGAILGGAILGGAIGAFSGAIIGIGGTMIGSGLGMVGGFSGLATALAGGGTIAAGAAAGIGSMALGGAVVIGGVAVAGLGVQVLMAKRTGKEGATDKPSWVTREMIDPNKSPQENAQDLLNDKYGFDKWAKGSNTEFSKIVKWITRHIRFKR